MPGSRRSPKPRISQWPQCGAYPTEYCRPMVLKNSLSAEKVTPAAKADLCNRTIFDYLTSRKASAYPEKIRFRVFQQNRPETDCRLFFQAVMRVAASLRNLTSCQRRHGGLSGRSSSSRKASAMGRISVGRGANRSAYDFPGNRYPLSALRARRLAVAPTKSDESVGGFIDSAL